jgi:photosystem II stability/assembly factor-like uncharacterized protein
VGLICAGLAAGGIPARAGWLETGPYGGSAQIVAIDPSNSKSLLAGTRSALLYRSLDAGETWEPLPFPRLFGVSIYSIAIDPKRPGLYFIGAAEETGRQGDTGAGLYRSDDAGKHWVLVEALKNKSVFSLAIWSGDSQVIVAGTGEGLWRTLDGGDTWNRNSSVDNPEMQKIVSLAFHPSNKDILYAGTPHLPWKTTDGGATWTSIHSGLIDDSDVFSLRVDPSQPERVFASACSGIYCSRDSGGQWTKLKGIPGTDRRTHIITQDPGNPAIVYAGTTAGLWKSLDGGLTWVKKSNHSINWMAVDPADPKTLYLATEASGIIKSVNGGDTFEAHNRGFVNRSITQFALSGAAGKPALFASTAYDGDFGGMFRSEDSGASWSLLATHAKMLNENLVTFAVSPDNSKVIWAASYDGLLKSSDAGLMWTRPKAYIEPPAKPIAKAVRKGVKPARPAIVPLSARAVFPPAGARVYQLLYVPTNPPRLLAGTDAGLFRSTDGGLNWKEDSPVSSHRVAVYAIFVSESNPEAIATLTREGLYGTFDGGTEWRPLSIPGRPDVIHEVAFDPTNPRRMLVATSSGLFGSNNGGDSWSRCDKGLPEGLISAVAFDSNRPETVFAAQAGALFRSGDKGETWKEFDSEGLEAVWVHHLQVGIAGPGTLFAVSNSRGVYVRSESTASAASFSTVSTR